MSGKTLACSDPFSHDCLLGGLCEVCLAVEGILRLGTVAASASAGESWHHYNEYRLVPER